MYCHVLCIFLFLLSVNCSGLGTSAKCLNCNCNCNNTIANNNVNGISVCDIHHYWILFCRLWTNAAKQTQCPSALHCTLASLDAVSTHGSSRWPTWPCTSGSVLALKGKRSSQRRSECTINNCISVAIFDNFLLASVIKIIFVKSFYFMI